MYLDFYHLKEEPFQIVSAPEFLFLSPSHKEALAAIMYSIERRRGLAVVIGEVGVGKTTILRTYLERTEPEDIKILCVYCIYKIDVAFKELIKTILRELQFDPETDDLGEMIYHLQGVLKREYSEGLNVVLIIDEAQNMTVDALENLRVLSNMEIGKDKILQIVLIGQPELERKLNLYELRQLKQRTAVRGTIFPLTQRESLAYIHHRLSMVAMTSEPIFTRRALKRIVKQAKGIPRILNILCDNALINGFGYQQKPISARVVTEVVADTEGKKMPPPLRWRLAYTAGGVLLAGILWLLAYQGWMVAEGGRLTLAQTLQAFLSKGSVQQAAMPSELPSAAVPHTPTVASRRKAVAQEANALADSLPYRPDEYECLLNKIQGEPCSSELVAPLHREAAGREAARREAVGQEVRESVISPIQEGAFQKTHVPRAEKETDHAAESLIDSDSQGDNMSDPCARKTAGLALLCKTVDYLRRVVSTP